MAPINFHLFAATSLGLPSESYIYNLVPTSHALAAISSDDSLRLFSRQTLQLLPDGVVHTPHHGLKCITGPGECEGEGILVTGGEDGVARMWDMRDAGRRAQIAQFGGPSSPSITALAFDQRANSLVVGAELASSQATITAWDVRSPSRSLFQFVESHNDDITVLTHHPSYPNILLSGSTDGLVNIYDTSIPNEEDALCQVIPHSSIHHAGFVTERTVYALSHDETFALHPLNPVDGVEQGAGASGGGGEEPSLMGDVRPSLECEYTIQLVRGQGPALAVGSHSHQRVDLVPLENSLARWSFDPENTVRLAGGHGEEIVRAVFLDSGTRSVFSAGEDGMVRVWAGDS